MTTARARHRAIDRLRRDRVLAAKLACWRPSRHRGDPEEDGMVGPPIPDERLELVFMCCHPALAIEAQVALTLRAVAGLTTEEIARAFLVPAETMKRRLTRAKSKIKVAGIPFAVPVASQLPERLLAVLAVVYLIFNEGYSEPDRESNLAAEAIRLGRVLAVLLPSEPEVLGLLALMLLHDARREARFDGQDLVLLAGSGPVAVGLAADRRGQGPARPAALLDPALSAGPGRARPVRARRPPSPPCRPENPLDWPQIAALYGELADRTGSAVVRLNRAVAIAEADGPAAALAIVDGLDLRGLPVLALDPGRTPPPPRPRRRGQGRLPRGARAGPHRSRAPLPRTPHRRNASRSQLSPPEAGRSSCR